MLTIRTRSVALLFPVVSLASIFAMVACGGSPDDPAVNPDVEPTVTGHDGAAPDAVDRRGDAAERGDPVGTAKDGGGATAEAAAEAGDAPRADAGVLDAQAPSEPDGDAARDASAPDPTNVDAGALDASVAETGVVDASRPDATAADAGIADAAVEDASAVDATVPVEADADAPPSDAGAVDASDTGAVDASDAAADAADAGTCAPVWHIEQPYRRDPGVATIAGGALSLSAPSLDGETFDLWHGGALDGDFDVSIDVRDVVAPSVWCGVVLRVKGMGGFASAVLGKNVRGNVYASGNESRAAYTQATAGTLRISRVAGIVLASATTADASASVSRALSGPLEVGVGLECDRGAVSAVVESLRVVQPAPIASDDFVCDTLVR